jgi:hypothetical protein
MPFVQLYMNEDLKEHENNLGLLSYFEHHDDSDQGSKG